MAVFFTRDTADGAKDARPIGRDVRVMLKSAGLRPTRQRVALGDLLFAVVNLARHLGVEPTEAMLAANAKFERRFRHIERALEAQGRTTSDASLDEMEALWDQAKKIEKAESTCCR